MTVSRIYQRGPSQPLSPDVAAERAWEAGRIAWHKHGLAMLRVEEIVDDFERQAVTNAANKKFGPRRTEQKNAKDSSQEAP